MPASHSDLAVLVIDDDPGIRSSLSRILRHDGYRVDLAATVAQAMDRDNWQDYFAILLDRRLPDGSADDLLQQIVEQAAHAAVLVITGYADLESSLAAIRAGAADYLLKPVDPDALRTRLRTFADLKLSQDEVRKRDTQVQFMIDHLPAGAAYVDNKTGAVRLNPTVERLTGFADDELPDRDTWFRTLFGERGKKYRLQYEKDRLAQFPQARTLTLRTKDGREILTEFNAYQYNEHEVWMIHDVTERLRVQEELQQQRDFSDRLLETAQAIVLILSPDGKIVRFNQFMQELTGYPLEEVVGQDWFELFIPEEDAPRIKELFSKVVDGEEVRDHVNAIQTRDGRQLRIAWSAKTLCDPDGQVTEVLSIGHDITAFREMQDKLVQSERLAAIGQVIAGLAHESRNALQRARACLDMLSLDLSDQPRQIDLTGRIETALEELQRLYEEVRNYAAPVKLSLGRCNLQDVWHMSWQHIVQTYKELNVSFSDVVGDIETACIADCHRIEQVFRNVFENAVAASPAGGKVTLSCQDAELDGKPAVMISIADEGPGLTTEQIEHIFEPFFTTKQKGTGLGMAISHRIVSAHDGVIAVVQEKQGGAVINITLPRGL